MNTGVMFSKASDEWQTPPDLFATLHNEFRFDCDMAAMRHNRMVPEYWGPDHRQVERRNALVFDWPAVCWLNPPYSQCRAFLTKAAQEAQRGSTVVCLVPSRTDTRWWHETVWDVAPQTWRPGVEARFLRGRLKFGGGTNSAPFPSVILVFRRP